MLRIRSMFFAVLCGVAVAAVGTGSAFAGESTGNGKVTPIAGYVAASICSFSGLNPEPDEPGRTQSFGQIVRFAGPLGGIPGFACNPTRGE